VTEQPEKARTAIVRLRLPWVYQQGAFTPKPGMSGIVDRAQLRAMRSAVISARNAKMVKASVAEEELAAIDLGLKTIADGPLRDVGAYFPADGCIGRQTDLLERRAKEKRRKKARKAQRKKKG
jgi:hypothetical protein